MSRRWHLSLVETLHRHGYRLGDSVGMGGYGVVYRAERIADGARVAIKVLHPGGQDEQERTSRQVRFRREAEALRALEHPGCVRCLDFGESESGELFMVQEFVDGWPLNKKAAQVAADPVWAVRIVVQLLATLADAHREGIIHRDIKPANLMLTRVEGRDEPDRRSDVRLLDFGIARLCDPDVTSGLTRGGLGTPAFMAPEQFLNEVSAASDLYAVGAVLYYLLTGRKPFAGDLPVLLYQAHANAPRPRLPADPLGLQPVLDRALAPSPADRFPDADAMRVCLEDILRAAGEPLDDIARTVEVDAPPVALSPPRAQSSASSRARVAAIVVVAVTAVVAVIAVVGILFALTPEGEGSSPIAPGAAPGGPSIASSDDETEAPAPDGMGSSVAPARPIEGPPTGSSSVEVPPAVPQSDAQPTDAAVTAPAGPPPPDAALPDARSRGDVSTARRPKRTRRVRPVRGERDPLTLEQRFSHALASCQCDTARTLKTRLDQLDPGGRSRRAELHYLPCDPTSPSRCQ